MSRIDPANDFAGFVDQRLAAARKQAGDGLMELTKPWIAARVERLASEGRSDAIEDLARHFDRAAAEIRSIAKVIRRKHGITADDEIRREREAAEERRIANQPAADPWIKIEPGCAMPEDDVIVLICIKGLIAIGCYNAKFGWWTRGQLATPTHYAVVRLPEAE